MSPDLKATPEAVRLLVEEYGSVAHLARTMDVTATQLKAWLEGTEAIPLERYRQMMDVVATRTSKGR